MSRIVHINSFATSGCVALIARAIVSESARRGYENVFAYGRGDSPDCCESIRVGCLLDFYGHALESRLLDDQGKGSRRSTRHFIEQLNELNPDAVHLHNIHGSYLNYHMLFDWVAQSKVKVIWTLHDCWPFTGHCAYYDYVSCSKWKSGCKSCPRTGDYPKSWLIDRSESNYRDKRSAFTSVGPERMHLVTPSKWLAQELSSSFLKAYPVSVIPNGIDFEPSDNGVRRRDGEVKLLAVANKWHDIKGLSDLRELSGSLDFNKYSLTLVGSISNRQKKGFASQVHFAGTVEGRRQIANLYAESDVFLNLTHEDNFPTVNIEALRSGLPVISYGAGGSGEATDDQTGYIVRDVFEVRSILDSFVPSESIRALCVKRSMRYTAHACAASYCDLYDEMVG